MADHPRKQKKKNTASKSSKWFLIGFFLLFAIILLRFQIGDALLGRFGNCTTAQLTSELRSVKYVKPTYVYRFWVSSKDYKGNSLIQRSDSAIKGDICVVYLPLLPCINRPARYLADGIQNCNCK